MRLDFAYPFLKEDLHLLLYVSFPSDSLLNPVQLLFAPPFYNCSFEGHETPNLETRVIASSSASPNFYVAWMPATTLPCLNPPPPIPCLCEEVFLLILLIYPHPFLTFQACHHLLYESTQSAQVTKYQSQWLKQQKCISQSAGG